MAYPDELLALASRLADTRVKAEQQASYRRAISTAYYALFHLLVSEATSHWSRPLFGRLFAHGKMKAACNAVPGVNPNKPKAYPRFSQRTTEDHWSVVASSFIEAQSQRERADYDISFQLAKSQAEAQVERVDEAFRGWAAIRSTPEAHRFLLELLGPRQERR